MSSVGGGEDPRQAQDRGTDRPPVVHDRRRIDPTTGQVRGETDGGRPSAQRSAGPEPPGKAAQAAVAGVAKARAARERRPTKAARAEKRAARAEPAVNEAARQAAEAGERMVELEATIAERTADLQRLSAEYANYRKRVERDREATKGQARAEVLGGLLDALDDIGRAREHGELEGGFKSVAEAVERAAAKFGLERYGEAGEPFDPTVHDALLHSYTEDVTEPTCVTILQPGYRIGERILRAARVAVAEPEPYDPSGGTTSD